MKNKLFEIQDLRDAIKITNPNKDIGVYGFHANLLKK